MNQRILVAGIGNIFFGDDAFGVEVAQRMARRDQPDGVQVADFGIRGFDLAYAILDDYDATILVDTVQRGGAPGTLYVIEPDIEELETLNAPGLDTHNIDPVKVLSLVRAHGGQPRGLYLVGCEPATFGPDEGQMGLSEPVTAVLDEAQNLVESLISEILTASGDTDSGVKDECDRDLQLAEPRRQLKGHRI